MTTDATPPPAPEPPKRRRVQHRRERCISCGADIRDGGRCPFCERVEEEGGEE